MKNSYDDLLEIIIDKRYCFTFEAFISSSVIKIKIDRKYA